MKKIIVVIALLLSISTISRAQTTKLKTGYLYKIETTVPGRQIYICGQRPVNANGDVVGQGNLDTQLLQVFDNITTSLASIGMKPDNIVQVTYHIQNDMNKNSLNNDRVNQLAAAYFNQNKAGLPRISELKTVQNQVREDVLIEVEVVAIKN